MQTRNLLKAVAIILPTGLILSAGAAFAFSLAGGSAAPVAAPMAVPVIGAAQEGTDAKPATRPADDYPLDTCIVGGKLGSMGEPVVKKIDGRTVKFCCGSCVATFEKDKEKYHAKMDGMIIEAQKEKYPLDVCLVSGEDLGAMGEPMMAVHRPTNQLVKFCCGSCEVMFNKTPEKYLAKLDAARRGGESK